jgi:hypothetical protein
MGVPLNASPTTIRTAATANVVCIPAATASPLAAKEAPGVRLRFVPKTDKDSESRWPWPEPPTIASVPERHTEVLRPGMHSFPLPVPTPKITVSLLWHPRLDADPAHRWLRGCVRKVCAE